MEFEGCLNTDQWEACWQLLRSNVSFEPFPRGRKIRLALPSPLSIPLNLTLHHGPCAISCEGGEISGCETNKTSHYWTGVSSSFYFENCIPSHNYCVTASIGECCPVCTKTIFMEDFHHEQHHEDSLQWDIDLIVIILSVIFLSFMAILKVYFSRDSIFVKQKPQSIASDPQTQHILEIENNRPMNHVVFLYVREHNAIFLDMVDSIQEFLLSKGINVIDIYNEEENINKSVTKWVQRVTEVDNTKILILDTTASRQLWNGKEDCVRILKPLEQVICYTRSCIPVTNVHKYLFLLRFQGTNLDTKSCMNLSDGRCYVYPIHKERLADDLKS